MPKKKNIIPKANNSPSLQEIERIYGTIKEILETARSRAYHAVNVEMVQAYWNIGRVIVEEEQGGKERAAYGTFLIKHLSELLTINFGKGFFPRNLERMRQFYLLFLKATAMRSELSWTHYRILLKVKDEAA